MFGRKTPLPRRRSPLPKPTIQDVAQKAGLSPATVDRALNGRGGVSQTSLIKINDAVVALGFGVRTNELTQQMRPKARLRFIIPKGGGGFIQNMKTCLRAACDKAEDVDSILEFIEIEMTPQIIVDRLNDARLDGTGAVGLFAMDTPGVRDAIDRCVAAGVPVLTMVSDVPAAHRTSFVGIDNSAAGRTAARLMGKFLRGETGKVAVIAGSMKVRDHMERFFAFRQAMSRDFRNITVLPVYETKSLDRYNMDCVKGLRQQHDDLLGIYMVTGGVTGVLAALREEMIQRRPVLIAHDITAVTKRGLIAGEIDAVINQNADQIAHASVEYLLAELIPNRPVGTAAKAAIGIDIFVAENLP